MKSLKLFLTLICLYAMPLLAATDISSKFISLSSIEEDSYKEAAKVIDRMAGGVMVFTFFEDNFYILAGEQSPIKAKKTFRILDLSSGKEIKGETPFQAATRELKEEYFLDHEQIAGAKWSEEVFEKRFIEKGVKKVKYTFFLFIPWDELKTFYKEPKSCLDQGKPLEIIRPYMVPLAGFMIEMLAKNTEDYQQVYEAYPLSELWHWTDNHEVFEKTKEAIDFRTPLFWRKFVCLTFGAEDFIYELPAIFTSVVKSDHK